MSRIGGELSDVRIGQLVKKYKLRDFGGCLSKDQLIYNNPGKFYIINMENHTGPGTHWVLLDARSPRVYQYCDSFGVIPPTEVVNWARAHGAKLRVNKVDMQNYHSDACGWYCLYMMAQMQRGRDMRKIVGQDFVNLRTKMPRRNNDQVLKNFFA